MKRHSSGAVEFGGTLKLRADSSPTFTPELHFHSYNGQGTDKLAWGLGIDVSAPIPARDFAIFKAVGGSVADEMFANGRGSLPASWAVSQAPADDAFKFSVVSAGAVDIAQGGLKVQIGGTTTQKALLLRDGASDRWWMDNTFTMKGNHALAGSSVCVEADLTNHRPVVFRDSDGTNYMGWYYSSGNLRFRSVSSALDFFQCSAAANHFYVYTPFVSGNATMLCAAAGQTLGYFGSVGANKWTSLPANATDLASAIALVNDIKNNVLIRHGMAA
ncbi:MAG: hypothetical protein ABR609_07850 [Acidimicrobiia bacterium]